MKRREFKPIKPECDCLACDEGVQSLLIVLIVVCALAMPVACR